MSRRRKNCKIYCNSFCQITILIISFFIATANSPKHIWAADVFIDPGQINSDEDGSFANPFNSWYDIKFNAADDYYQKCGTTATLSSFYIGVSGQKDNHVVIGAYYEKNGSPVIESDSPSYGEFCKNGDPKPILANNDHVGSVVNLDGEYIELNSIQIKYGDTSLYVRDNNNVVVYCRIGWGYWGVRIGLSGHADGDHNYIGYNYIYTDTGKPSTDGLQMGVKASYNLIEFNVLDGWDHTGISTSYLGADHNEIRYNTILSWDDENSECLIPNGRYNKFHHNYCKDAGDIQIVGGSYNEVSYNIIDGIADNGTTDQGIILLQPSNLSGIDVTDNKIYNNLIFDRRDGWPNPIGIFMYSREDGGVCERNEIINNIVLNLDSKYQPFRVLDSYNKIDSSGGVNSNIWKNNLAYGYTGTYYAKIEEMVYKTAEELNNRSYSYSANRDDNPGLENPADSKFWPASLNSAVVGNGKDLGVLFKNILDPDQTDWTTQHPTVVSEPQPTEWYIGPFSLPDGFYSKPMLIAKPSGFRIISNSQ